MPERPRPDLDRVRDTLRDRDEEITPEPEEETPEQPSEEDDGDT
jgi:hypothetical protein